MLVRTQKELREEPKQKQHPVVDVSAGKSKVQFSSVHTVVSDFAMP